MKILMLGWEYPPHIAGGLGTACEGLTKGLARLGVKIQFVVPRLFGGESAPHMTICDPMGGRITGGGMEDEPETEVERIGIPALLKPYWNNDEFVAYLETLKEHDLEDLIRAATEASGAAGVSGSSAPYGSDIFQEIARYTQNVLARMSRSSFDIIHAHDWMTYPAGVALAKLTGKPLVVHVHSIEYDRSGANGNGQIRDIEGLGITSADSVVCVSHYTKSLVNREYGAPLDRTYVVHNGIYSKNAIDHYRSKRENGEKKVVLFLGRITFQKGPDYFVQAAAKVVPHVPNVVFVMAGSGDMLPRVQQMVKDNGLEANFHFPGFLNEREVEATYSSADLYVMPSVSEPFGITALEAIDFSTPALISRQSGVSEVIGHTLKFDFWDVDRLADLIINGLLHDELRADMVAMAKQELRRLRWDASAMRTLDVYNRVIH